MHKPLWNKVTILGLGLIGSSLARSLMESHSVPHIAAFDISQDTLRYTLKEKFIHSAHHSAAEACTDADIIVLATPPSLFESIAQSIQSALKPQAIVTDTGSVKRQAIAHILPYIALHVYFVPGHPIAGGEKTGVQAGRADLFVGKQVILTPQESDVLSNPVQQVRLLWESTGAKVGYMPADLHDMIYASVSHLPQIVAFACAPLISKLPPNKDELFNRFTRLTRSNRELWADICLANGDYINEALQDFITFATQMAGELAEGKEEAGEEPEMASLLFIKVVAACLVAAASQLEERTGVHPLQFAGSGFLDMTASVKDDPQAALEAISKHPGSVGNVLKDIISRLLNIKQALEKKDRTRLVKLFHP